jgi:hypothetical protein
MSPAHTPQPLPVESVFRITRRIAWPLLMLKGPDFLIGIALSNHVQKTFQKKALIISYFVIFAALIIVSVIDDIKRQVAIIVFFIMLEASKFL